MKKIFLFILIVTFGLSTTTAAFSLEPISSDSKKPVSYTDLKSTNWAYPAVKEMSDKNILKGYADGSFKPSNTLTYGEFIKMIVLSLGVEDPGNAVNADGTAIIDETTGQKMNWAQKYYDIALNKQLFTIYQIHNSKLDNEIPRGEMAILISSALGDFSADNYEELKEGITDIAGQSKYQFEIIKSYAAGVLTGYEDKSFKAEGTLNRAEAATVIYRLVDESKRVLPQAVKQEKPTTSQDMMTSSTAIKGVTGNVKDIIKNYDSFTYPNGTIDEPLMEAKTFTIVEDITPYKLELKENRGTKWLESTGLNSVYLMKDGNVTEWLNGNETYRTDITKADYIVSVDSEEFTVILIPNPFKK